MTMDGDSIWGSRDYQVPQYFNFADVIDDWAEKEKHGDKVHYNPALWWSDGDGQEVKWSFQDLASISKKAANVLYTVANVTSGDRVMVLVPRIPEYWLMQVACFRTGAILVPVPTNIGCAELQRRIFLIKPTCFVSNGVIENNLLNTIDEFSSSSSAVKCRLMFNRMKNSNRNSWLSFDELLQQASSDYQSVNSLSSAPIAIVFTSGTTGNAKMVEHSHGSWGLQNRTGMDRLGMGIVESDLVWSQSGTGWVILLAMAVSSWSVGAGVFAHYRNLNGREALEILLEFPITFTFLLPSIYINAVKEDLRRFHFSKLSSCMTTGEPMDKEVMLKWKEATGIDIRSIYGQTEAGALCCTPRNGEVRIGSVGQPFPSVDLVITDDNNQEVSPGHHGRVMVRVKPYRPVPFFTHYVDDPHRTAACFSGDFYITGDIGFKDEDGYFWILGRTDDIIFVNGLNINPHDVEHCLSGHPAVLECAVVSSPNTTGQECAKAFVVLSSEFQNKEENEVITELQDHMMKNAGAWMKPAKKILGSQQALHRKGTKVKMMRTACHSFLLFHT
ncbi:acyl-coenzyme A synthetase ACSM4, mitochondrial-like isoform X2 [Montipora capricornis]|uniref:acyl-coenzyme A synthetase ACSM4, mitochondrial-like isoform X2 n=1 Tax=Montipora capricornis TaxID=246305 RepID=UPI0035F170D1